MKKPVRKINVVLPLTALAALGLSTALWVYVYQVGSSERRRTVDTAVALTRGGNPEAGRRVIMAFGCGACHRIPGIPGAHGKIGPSLLRFKDRAMIAGVLANSADNLVQWIQDPPGFDPKTAMPNLGLSPQEARDAAAYLYAPEN